MKILITEDDGLEAQEIERHVRALGHQSVGTAATGRRSVEMTRTIEPDLVLMDIEMPGMDGISAARKILSIRPIPIVLVTAHSEPELVEQAAGAGIFSYLLKPVGQRNLDAAMQIAQARFAELQVLHK